MAPHKDEEVFSLGDEVEVHPRYIAEHPERDCTGQAVIVEVIDNMFMSGKMYGVAFPRMEEGFRYYWIGPDLLRHSVRPAVSDSRVEGSSTREKATCYYCHDEVAQDSDGTLRKVFDGSVQCASTWYDHGGVGRHMGHSVESLEEMVKRLARYDEALTELNRTINETTDYSEGEPDPTKLVEIALSMVGQIERYEEAVVALNRRVLGRE